MKNKTYFCYRMGERLEVVNTYIQAKNTCTRAYDYALADKKFYGRLPGQDFRKLTKREFNTIVKYIKENKEVEK